MTPQLIADFFQIFRVTGACLIILAVITLAYLKNRSQKSVLSLLLTYSLFRPFVLLITYSHIGFPISLQNIIMYTSTWFFIAYITFIIRTQITRDEIRDELK